MSHRAVGAGRWATEPGWDLPMAVPAGRAAANVGNAAANTGNAVSGPSLLREIYGHVPEVSRLCSFRFETPLFCWQLVFSASPFQRLFLFQAVKRVKKGIVSIMVIKLPGNSLIRLIKSK